MTTTEEEVVEGEIVPNEPNNLPAPTDTEAVLALIETDEEWDGVDAGDLTGEASRIPYLSMNRKLDGGFVDTDTGEVSNTIEFVALARSKSRVYFERPYDAKGDGQPTCRSADGIVGMGAYGPDSDANPTGKCASCPMNRWSDDPQDRTCREAQEMLVFLPDPMGYGRLARTRWSGLAVKPARQFWDSFFTRVPKRVPLAYVSKATLEPTPTANGQFLVPRFERLRELTRAQAQPLIEERDARLADFRADIADDIAEGRNIADAESRGSGPFDDAAVDAKGNPVDCPGHAEGDHVNACIQSVF